MIRPTARSLALLLFASPLVIVSCGSGSKSPDALPPDAIILGSDVAPKLDTVIQSDTAPVSGPEAGVDTLIAQPDTAVSDARLDTLVVPTDARTDTTVDTAPITPDGPVRLDATPDLLADRTPDSPIPTDTAVPTEAGAPDTTPPTCTAFTGGDVTANLTLYKACSPYSITDDIYVDGNATLTVEAGATLAFAEGVGISIGYTNAGKLVATGTAQNLITFTSAASSPAAGDWNTIRFWDGTMGGTTIAYAKLDYCGSNQSACVMGSGVKANRVTLDHLTIDHVGSGSNGIMENDEASNFAITNSTFSNIPSGQYAISVQASSFAGIGPTNLFNNGAMIELAGGTVATTTSWVDPGTPIAVTSRLDVDGAGTPILTLGAGMILKFDSDVELSVGYGTSGKLAIVGTAAKPVTLTSLAASPAAGDWDGILVWEGAKASISYATVSYGGGSDSGGDLVLESGTSTSQLLVDHSTFTYSLGYGIYLPCTDTPSATVTLTSNTYGHNASDTANANNEASNVGPGFAGSTCHH